LILKILLCWLTLGSSFIPKSILVSSKFKSRNKRIFSHQTRKTKETSEEFDYWSDPRIHSFGNTGLGGIFHAALTPVATFIIDHVAYDGRDIRDEVISQVPPEFTVCDFGCGTGFSTRKGSTGIDTSMEMIRFAKLFHPHNTYSYGNIEDWGNDKEFDVIFISFVFHEMPKDAMLKAVNNAKRVAKKGVIIIDIAPDYQPKEHMLMGEPYLLDYLKDAQNELSQLGFKFETLIPGHVVKYTYSLNENIQF